jgi:hypothetical protein
MFSSSVIGMQLYVWLCLIVSGWDTVVSLASLLSCVVCVLALASPKYFGSKILISTAGTHLTFNRKVYATNTFIGAHLTYYNRHF